ncbi:hypothetical protein BRD00_02345 [Halobacteriales archaeon QS_8_69_26]|nr:MAG: hypothetical protein BRD00_02345 [Halobacteriales archaeon QS_8_69_26]
MASLDRRAFLRRVGAAGATALTGSLAGCGSLGGSGSGRRTTFDVPERTRTTADPERATTTDTTGTGATESVEFGSVPVPEDGEPTYRRWLPAPDAFPFPADDPSSDPSYPIWHADLDRIRRLEDGVPSMYENTVRRSSKLGLDHLGIGFGNYREVVRLGRTRTYVVEAPVDRGAVGGTLLGSGYRGAGRHREYRLFARSDDPRAVAVGPEAVVFAGSHSGVDGSLDAVRTVVDAAKGAVPRYHEADDEFDHLLRRVGGSPMDLFDPGEDPVTAKAGVDFDGLVGYGWTHTFDADVTYERHTFALDRPGDPGAVREKLRRFAAEAGMQEAWTVDVTVDGQTAEVVAAFPDHRLEEDRPAVTYPTVTWGFDHEREGDELRVTVIHEAGDEVPAENLKLERLRGRETISTFEGSDTVGPGDSVTALLAAEPSPGGVRLVWNSPKALVNLTTYEFG